MKYPLILAMISVAKEYDDDSLRINFVVDNESEERLKQDGYQVMAPEMITDPNTGKHSGPFTSITWKLN